MLQFAFNTYFFQHILKQTCSVFMSLLLGASLLSHHGLLVGDRERTNLVTDQIPLLLAVVLTEELHLVGRKVHRVLKIGHEMKPAASHASKKERKVSTDVL